MDFRILGALEARANGSRLPLGGPKQRALLAMLLLEANEVVSRDRLIDGLWGESPPPTASHTLDSYVSRLRKTLADDGARLITRPPGYLLRTGPGELDLDRFERLAADGARALDAGEHELAARKLREAESLWRGRPLADVEYEPFAQAHVQRLEELALEATEQRVDAELTLGHCNGLIAELEALVARHPLRERLRGQLMLALYRAGRQADALAAFRDGRVLLREELGLEPSPHLQELELAMLKQDPALEVLPIERDAATEPARRSTRWRLAVVGTALCAAAIAAVGVRALFDASDEDQPAIDGNTVALVDANTARTIAASTLRARPAAAASGTDSVWVATPDAGSVVRINPDTGAVRQTVHVGGAPNAVAVGAGAVWVADALEGRLSRIDPQTETVVQTIRVGRGPGGVAVGDRVVWVSNTISSTISRIDARSGAVVHTAPLDARPGAVAIGAGAIWVASESQNRVLRLDPASGEVRQTITVGTGPGAIAVGLGAVWVANRLDGTVTRIDPRRGVATDTFGVSNGLVDLAVGANSVWVAGDRGTLTEIDPRQREVVRTLRIGGRPQAVTVAGRNVFVGVAAAGPSHRGGTLRFVTPIRDFASIDPATLISVQPAQLLGLTNDGLVSLNRVGGAAGLRVVPDLAIRLPTPTDSGRTYSFELRPRIRYSNASRVEARDFRYAIERLFALDSPVAAIYRGLIGAGACEARPNRCDLSEGIVADNAGRRVTFHLSTPDPDFLAKLALPYAYAVPAGSAPREARHEPLPATGPYMIASYRPGRSLRLVRNPRFREWSTAAQPDGYADAIVWKLGVNLDNALTAVEQGRADWVLNYEPLPRDRRREIRTRYAAQTHANAVPLTYYYFMNTRVPPFDDVSVRRAVNYAVDRRALARLYRGTPTCHVVPPQLPGHSAYCPYRHDPAKAQRLIAASGTAGMRVRVIADARTADLAYMVRLLRTLGYRASPWVVPGRRYGPTISDSRNRVQIGSGGWGADYAAASNFFDVKFSCRVFRPANPFNNNDSEFCDRRIDARAEQARRLGLTDPAAATREWERVYRDIVDRAPWVPTVTPTWIDFVSKRVGNYQFHPLWGVLAQQLWVR